MKKEGKVRPLYPLALEKRYVKSLDKRLRGLTTQVAAADMSGDDLQLVLALVERVGVAHETTFIASGPTTITRVGTQLTQWQDRTSAQFLGKVAGLSPRKLLDFFTGKPLGKLISIWAAENVRLIQSVESAYIDQVQTAIIKAFDEGISTSKLTKTIEGRSNVARSRARLIARDQIASLNHDVTKRRQTALGITEYTWLTSMDERVREEHAERHGQVYSWADPPEDGNPGEPIQCRCIAAPVIPRSLDLFS